MEQIIAARVARNIPPNCTVKVQLMDYAHRLGVAVELPDFTRHAVMVLIERDDLTKAADEAAEALAEWMRSR
jgi:hypothetical protein